MVLSPPPAKRRLIILAAGLLFACSEKTDVPKPSNKPLEIVTTELAAVALGSSYDVKVEVRGGTSPYTFAISDGAAPNGIELKAATGQLTGLAGAPGSSMFTIAVTDAAAATVSRAFTLYVTPDPLEVVTTRLPDGQEGTPYAQTLNASGGVPAVTWSVAQGNLPNGLALAADGRLSGTPTEFGGFEFAALVSDSEDTQAQRTLQLFVASLDPMIETSTVPKARIAQLFEVRFAADGGTPPYTWNVSTGNLPMGLSLASDGVLAGTPSEAGDFTFSVRAEDSAQRTDEASFTLVVIPPLLIATTALPQVIRGRPYDESIIATGGVPPYSWSMRTGTLPTGLMFDALQGRVHGTTTEAGDSDVSIRVRDSEGAQKTALFTVSVNDRFSYEVTPMASFPPVCTSTKVSYLQIPIDVPDSMQIADIDVEVDVDFSDADEPNQTNNTKMKLVIYAPDGSRVPLCGNGAGIRGWQGCDGRNGVNAAYGDTDTPGRPLSTFEGTNAQGRWYFAAVVSKPTRRGGQCEQQGVVNRVALSIRDDRSADPYIFVRGFTKNNLAIEPWVRIAGGGVDNHELWLSATIYDVGPNGLREGGAGDDVPRMTALTWTFSGSAQVATVTPDGHVVAGASTGNGALVAAGDGMDYQTRLLVFAPDWNPATRDY